MPLDAVTLQSDLEGLFASPPPSAPGCAAAWAAAARAYATAIVPLSTTVATAAVALEGALVAAFGSLTAPADFDAAFAAFAAAVGAGMLPAFVATPPPLPLAVGVLLAGSQPTHAAAAAAFAALIDEWFRTGQATLVAPPFTVVTWS